MSISVWRQLQNMYLNQVLILRETERQARDSFQAFHSSEPIWSRDAQAWSSLLDGAMLLAV